jgi:long-chain acyl-CoA synthetase
MHFRGTLVLQPRFDAEELLQLIERHRITHFHIVPIMFVRLLKLPDAVRARYDLSSLRFVIHGAAPCPPDVKRAMIEWWGPVIHEYYGSTETSLVTHCDSAEWLARPGTTGRPMEGIEIRILDAEGRVLPPGATGDIHVRSPRIADFTYHNQDRTRRAMERDGFVTLGDVGYLDEDGYLFLNDRSRDMIISGGVNIYPAEIEAALHTLPGVHDCAVFGIPDPEYGERIAAVIEPRPDARLTADLVVDYLRPRLANYKLPAHIEFRSDLPREDSGKIFKRKLREPFWAAAGRRI